MQMAAAAPVPRPHDVSARPRRTLLAWIVTLVAMYGATMLATAALWSLLSGTFHVTPTPLPPERSGAYSLAFFLFFTPLLYLGPCALARRWLRPDPRTLAWYMGTAFLFGGLLEIVVDPLWIAVVGRPCWLYHVWPVHGGHTSGVGVVMWPMYGFFVGMLHHAIHVSPRLRFLDGHAQRAALLAVDAMLLEVAANLFALAFFGTWHFRYHRGDLAHFTTVEAFPIYVLGGYAGVRVLHALEHHRWRAQFGAVFFVVTAAAVLL